MSSSASVSPSSPVPGSATGSASSSNASSQSAASVSSPSSSPSAPPTSPSAPASTPSLPSSASSLSTASSITSSSAPLSTSATSLSTSSSSTILTAPSTTISQFTSVGTSDGQTFTTIVQITSTIAAGSTVVASSTRTRASHTGAIVGGVIGGLAFLVIVAGVLFWIRRRSRYKSEFDGNFDPARVTGMRPVSLGPGMVQTHATGGTLPRMDIEDDDDDGISGRPLSGGIVTPFAYTPATSQYGPSTRSQSPPVPSASPPPMSQYSQSQYSQDQPTLSSTGGYYTAVPQQAQAVGGYYPPAPSSSSSGNQYNPRSAKEREAGGARRSGVFAVSNPTHEPDSRGFSGGYDEQYQAYLRGGPQGRRGSQSEYNDPSSYPPLPPTGSSSGQRAGGVLVHQDGGRVEHETTVHEQADEIPPTYDSLPSGEQK